MMFFVLPNVTETNYEDEIILWRASEKSKGYIVFKTYFDCVPEINVWLEEFFANYMNLGLERTQWESLPEHCIPETGPIT